MTPYYWKTPKEGAERLAALDSLTTRIAFHVRKLYGVPLHDCDILQNRFKPFRELSHQDFMRSINRGHVNH